MKLIFALLLSLSLFFVSSTPVQAQIDSAAIKQRISSFADSLVRSYYEKDWNTFIHLTHPGIARLYGGMSTYVGIMQGIRARFEDSLQEKQEVVNVKQFLFAGAGFWQCIVERIRESPINGRNAKTWSYMIGQSDDDLGTNWKFFDVGDNLMINISSIMPDFSNELIVPEKKVVYDDEKAPAATTAAAKPKKKSSTKK
ncbi:MAG TPA: hypothetical protein VGM41_10575 [Chitinophagaceae bacterium]|jgi:hypothetical protein